MFNRLKKLWSFIDDCGYPPLPVDYQYINVVMKGMEKELELKLKEKQKMTVKELKLKLEGLPDDAEVYAESDHSQAPNYAEDAWTTYEETPYDGEDLRWFSSEEIANLKPEGKVTGVNIR